MKLNMHNINKKNNKKTKLVVLTIVSLLLVCLASLAVYAYVHRNDNEIERDANGISVERTPQDLALEENLENNPSDKTNNSQTDTPLFPEVDETTNKQNVNVILTNAGEINGNISASGFISNLVEENGTCTYIFTNGQNIHKKEATTMTNPNSTTCKTISFPNSELGTGVWKVNLIYSSSSAKGTSNILEVKM